ncbi:hypothetical protein PO909_028720 [Leuciscus waleckii]
MMDPLADRRAPQAERSSRGAAGGESADDQARGCRRNPAMSGSESLGSFADMEDSLEDKLKALHICARISPPYGAVTDSQGKDTETAGGLDLSLKTPGNVSQLFLLCRKAIQTTHFTC